VPDEVFAEMSELTDSAVRVLLEMIRLSFRFEPEKASWVKPDRTFTRSEIEAKCGLSCQGTRNGLEELADSGYVSQDKTGRSYEHELEIGVPTSRYTYVPTALLDAASGLGGTELRLTLAVIRTTWGWTTDNGDDPPTHRRWAQLSISELARKVGRSETAVKEAASGLQGRLLERLRPNGGAYHYRFLPEAIGPQAADGEASKPRPEAGALRVRTKKRASISMGIANELAPDRQNSAPPFIIGIERESSREAKQGSRKRSASQKPPENGHQSREDAMPEENDSPTNRDGNPSRRRRPPRERRRTRGPSHSAGRATAGENAEDNSGGNAGSPDLSRFPGRLQPLGEALINAGVNAGQVPGLLTRFSAERIEANFELFRRRAPSVKRPGAWLYSAITQGYAVPSPSGGDGTESTGGPLGSEGVPEPGTKVSETRKRELIRRGLATDDEFDRFKDFDDPDRKQHFFQVEKN
jgi:hypothetical protein